MPLPRGSKDGPEYLDEEGANACSVRAHLSLVLIDFNVTGVEVTISDEQQSQDPSAGSHLTP